MFTGGHVTSKYCYSFVTRDSDSNKLNSRAIEKNGSLRSWMILKSTEHRCRYLFFFVDVYSSDPILESNDQSIVCF